MTPNMGLSTIGKGTPPYVWATALNSDFLIIDQHDHSPGKGVQLSTLNIIVFRDFPVYTSVLSCGFVTFDTHETATNVLDMTAYSYGGDFYYTDNKLRAVQITAGNSLNVGSATGGGFSGDYVSAMAGCYYQQDIQTYLFLNTQTEGGQLQEIIAGSFFFNSLTLNDSAYLSFTPNITFVTAALADIDFNFTAGSGTDSPNLIYDTVNSRWYTGAGGSVSHFVIETSSSTSVIYNALLASYNQPYVPYQSANFFPVYSTINQLYTDNNGGNVLNYITDVYVTGGSNPPYEANSSSVYYISNLSFQNSVSYNLSDILGSTSQISYPPSCSLYIYYLTGNPGDTITYCDPSGTSTQATVTQINPQYYSTTPSGVTTIALGAVFISTIQELRLPCLQTMDTINQEFLVMRM